MKAGDLATVKHDISLNGGVRTLPAGTQVRVVDVHNEGRTIEAELVPDDGGVYGLNANDLEPDPI
jgi:uncharacterized Zn ribbon protein